MAMADMLHGYFVAGTQAEAEKFLQEYYSKLGVNLGEAAVSGVYNVQEDLVVNGSADQLTFQARVEVDGTTAKISFKTSVLEGTYDPATGTIVAKDRSTPADVMATTWWQLGNTTFKFDLARSPVTAVGRLVLKGSGNDLLKSLDVTLKMTKVSDL